MYSVGIIGTTGAVGTELLRVLETRGFPISKLHLFASDRSVGKKFSFHGEDLTIEPLWDSSFSNLDVAIFSAGSDISKRWRSTVEMAGGWMIDNSSAFRMDPNVPLVIPEINPQDLTPDHKIIAVPNCSTIILLMAVAPLRKFGRVKRIVVSTYQAVSGAGLRAMKELETQAGQYLRGEPLVPAAFPHPIAFNLFSHNAAVNDEGYNGEEWKMILESKKILHDEEIAITATCVRVPIFRAHSESINIEFEHGRPSVEETRELLAAFPGVKLADDRSGNHFPMPNEASGQFEVLAGHIRHDVSNPNAIDLFVSGDQLLKGAALDAVQIAESLVEQKLLVPRHRATK